MALAPYELLDDGFAPQGCDVVVIGCGNLLRGDDAVGPIAIRTLWTRGVDDGVRLVDGGTAGMDVAFQMRGARRVILIDASSTGAAPGTVFRVPGEWVEQLPPLTDIHTHAFRWDNALAFGRWLLGPGFPPEVDVFLIEAQSVAPGADLSPAVGAAMERVVELVLGECSSGGGEA
jgi:hydrogenase maturation protease